MNNEDIFAMAYGRWGAESQKLMLVEEMSELTTEIMHHLRGRNSLMELADEIADVKIMLAQVEYILSEEAMDYADFQAIVQKKLDEKLVRLGKRVRD